MKKQMTRGGQMSRYEMIGRLRKGETAIDLSIEKWDRVAMILSDPEAGIWGIETSCDTCALCQLHMELQSCSECPYFLHFGHRCDDNGHWNTFQERWDYDSAITMRDALKEVKAAFEEHPYQVVVTAEGMTLSDLVFELVTEHGNMEGNEEQVGDYIVSRTGLMNLLKLAEKAGDLERLEKKYGIRYV
jgi:hypothetical protein